MMKKYQKNSNICMNAQDSDQVFKRVGELGHYICTITVVLHEQKEIIPFVQFYISMLDTNEDKGRCELTKRDSLLTEHQQQKIILKIG